MSAKTHRPTKLPTPFQVDFKPLVEMQVKDGSLSREDLDKVSTRADVEVSKVALVEMGASAPDHEPARSRAEGQGRTTFPSAVNVPRAVTTLAVFVLLLFASAKAPWRTSALQIGAGFGHAYAVLEGGNATGWGMDTQVI